MRVQGTRLHLCYAAKLTLLDVNLVSMQRYCGRVSVCSSYVIVLQPWSQSEPSPARDWEEGEKQGERDGEIEISLPLVCHVVCAVPN